MLITRKSGCLTVSEPLCTIVYLLYSLLSYHVKSIIPDLVFLPPYAFPYAFYHESWQVNEPRVIATKLRKFLLPVTGPPKEAGRDLHPVSGIHFREGSGNARKAKAAIRADVSDDSEERLLSPHSYPPSQRSTFSVRTPDLSYRDPRDHAPISAPTVFSRQAAPLSLPQLDKYISSLPLPAFSSRISRIRADTKREKFVPLDRLASTGRSVEALETNYKRKPAWRNCNLILAGLVNTVLGVTVSAPIPRLFSLLDAS